VSKDLSGKTALVSGSTAGIGLAIARELGKRGALVWVNGRTEQRVQDAIAGIKQEVPNAKLRGVAADLTTQAGAELVFDVVKSVDVLVNNLGGVNAYKPFIEVSDAEWQHVYDLNVISGVRLSRHYLPSMCDKNWGRVVFIASDSGLQVPTEFIQYGVAKAAVIALARGIAETLVGSGVTVNSVLPGPTLSERIAKTIAASGKSEAEFEKEFFEKRRANSLLRRFITVDEVASMVGYVCSPAASATHGAALRVEGGIVKSAF